MARQWQSRRGSDFLTRTGAARKSDIPYGDCFSAMAARSVGVHLSAGASLTWPRGAQGFCYRGGASQGCTCISATSREGSAAHQISQSKCPLMAAEGGVLRVPPLLSHEAAVRPLRAKECGCNHSWGTPSTGGPSGAHLVDDSGHFLDELLLLREHRPLAEDEVDEPGSNLWCATFVCKPRAALSGVAVAAYHELHCAQS